MLRRIHEKVERILRDYELGFQVEVIDENKMFIEEGG